MRRMPLACRLRRRLVQPGQYQRTSETGSPCCFRRAGGVSFSPWPRSTDVESMVNAVRERLNDVKLKVFNTCTNTIREFQSWAYERTAKGELPPGDDAFVDADNHAMDVIKGIVAARPLCAQQM